MLLLFACSNRILDGGSITAEWFPFQRDAPTTGCKASPRVPQHHWSPAFASSSRIGSARVLGTGGSCPGLIRFLLIRGIVPNPRRVIHAEAVIDSLFRSPGTAESSSCSERAARQSAWKEALCRRKSSVPIASECQPFAICKDADRTGAPQRPTQGEDDGSILDALSQDGFFEETLSVFIRRCGSPKPPAS